MFNFRVGMTVYVSESLEKLAEKITAQTVRNECVGRKFRLNASFNLNMLRIR